MQLLIEVGLIMLTGSATIAHRNPANSRFAGVSITPAAIDAHWASDVIAGAALGTFVGHIVMEFNGTSPERIAATNRRSKHAGRSNIVLVLNGERE